MLICSKCRTENANTAKACSQCGAELSARDFGGGVTTAARETREPEAGTGIQEAPRPEATTEARQEVVQGDLRQTSTSDDSCPSCGEPASAGATFCGNCGKNLAGAEESPAEAKRSWMTGVVEVKVRPRPDLSVDDVIELLKKGFGGKYEIYKTPRWRGRQIMVRESASVGVAVDVKHRQAETAFLIGGTMPSDALNLAVRASFGLGIVTLGLWILLLRLILPTQQWRDMEGEVSEYLRKEAGLQ